MSLLTLPGQQAVACRIQTNYTTPFFEDVPRHIEAQAIADVIITGLTTSPRYGKPHYSAAWARVITPYKGPLKRYRSIRLITANTDCAKRFSPLQRGIVAGEVSRASDGVLEMDTISEALGERW